jgi:hypothetical protein
VVLATNVRRLNEFDSTVMVADLAKESSAQGRILRMILADAIAVGEHFLRKGAADRADNAGAGFALVKFFLLAC